MENFKSVTLPLMGIVIAAAALLYTGQANLRQDMAALRTEVRQDMVALRTEVREDMTGLRNELVGLRERVARLEVVVVEDGRRPRAGPD